MLFVSVVMFVSMFMFVSMLMSVVKLLPASMITIVPVFMVMSTTIASKVSRLLSETTFVFVWHFNDAAKHMIEIHSVSYEVVMECEHIYAINLNFLTCSASRGLLERPIPRH